MDLEIFPKDEIERKIAEVYMYMYMHVNELLVEKDMAN